MIWVPHGSTAQALRGKFTSLFVSFSYITRLLSLKRERCCSHSSQRGANRYSDTHKCLNWAEALLHTLTAEDEGVTGEQKHTSGGGRMLHTHKQSTALTRHMTKVAAPEQMVTSTWKTQHMQKKDWQLLLLLMILIWLGEYLIWSNSLHYCLILRFSGRDLFDLWPFRDNTSARSISTLQIVLNLNFYNIKCCLLAS